MSILEKIQSDVKDAMRARDTATTGKLRMLVAALQSEAKSKLRDLDEGEELVVLAREKKKRAEAAELYEKGGVNDKAAAERAEIVLIDAYMPEQMSDDELAKLVADAVLEAQATTPKDMGKVMKLLVPKIQGRADGKVVSQAVQKALSS